MTSRWLVVMRHGSAEPYAPTDLDRALTPRGVEEAAAAGRFLREHDRVPDHAAVSAATRTRQTWQVVREHAGATTPGDIERTLYNAEPETVLDVLRLSPPEAGTVLYLGHNPTASYLSSAFDGGDADPKAMGRLLRGFPPASLAVFEYDGEWADLALGAGRLVLCRTRD